TEQRDHLSVSTEESESESEEEQVQVDGQSETSTDGSQVAENEPIEEPVVPEPVNIADEKDDEPVAPQQPNQDDGASAGDDPVNHRRVLRDRSTLRAPPRLTYDKDGNQYETQDKAHMAESTTKAPDYDAFTIPANHEEAMASPWAEYWREAEREELKS